MSPPTKAWIPHLSKNSIDNPLELWHFLTMPNTLTHIGVQTPLTKLGIPQAPLQWIVTACLIPDIPWIMQRILLQLPGMDPLQLRLYTATQASFFYCLTLSLALAMLAGKSKQIFFILSTNSLLHLLLDASQIKWGNGVNFFAPFSWHTTHFNLIWPEHYLNTFFTVLGLIALAALWPKAIQNKNLLQKPDKRKAACAAVCFVVYFGSPPLFAHSAYEANIHYSQTLKDMERRSGKKIELDRTRYNTESNTVESLVDTHFKIANPDGFSSGTISIRGHFQDKETIKIDEFHCHKTSRDYASYVGLLLALLLWSHTLFQLQSTHKLNGKLHEQ